MAEARQWRAKRIEDVDLARRIVDVIIAADDMRHIHVPIIDHHAEIVRRHAITAHDDDIIKFLVADRDCALDQIVPGDITMVGIAKTDNRLYAGRRRLTSGVLWPPTAVVAWLQPPRPLLL